MKEHDRGVRLYERYMVKNGIVLKLVNELWKKIVRNSD
jgi:hypothetical protein